MWFVFPQLEGLGRSATAKFFGIRSHHRLSWLGPLLVWIGLVAGATMGASLYMRFGLAALWVASGAAALLAAASIRTSR